MASTHVEWRSDPYWRSRRVSPAQLLVYDIGVPSASVQSLLEINEVLPSTFRPALQDRDGLSTWLSQNSSALSPHEAQHLKNLANEYGWMNCLRCPRPGGDIPVQDQQISCRWM